MEHFKIVSYIVPIYIIANTQQTSEPDNILSIMKNMITMQIVKESVKIKTLFKNKMKKKLYIVMHCRLTNVKRIVHANFHLMKLQVRYLDPVRTLISSEGIKPS